MTASRFWNRCGLWYLCISLPASIAPQLAMPSLQSNFLESALFKRIDLDQVQPNLAWFIKWLALDEPVSVDVIIPSNVIMFVVGGAGAVSWHLGWPWWHGRWLGKSRWFRRDC